MRVRNQRLIRTLTLRILKARKARNIVAVIAVALTATLFTAVFAIGGNMLASTQNATMRMVGSSSHGGLKYLTQEQYDNLQASPLIKDISYNIFIAVAENDALQKKQTEIRYSEDDCAKWGFSYPTTGTMPRIGKELACSTVTLDMLGLPHELGQTVPLEFTVLGKKYSEDFTLVGFWQGDEVMLATQVWLSREYTDSIVTVPEALDWDNGFDTVVGTINADVWFGSSIDIEGKMIALLAERGYETGEIRIGINWAYAGGGETDITSVAVVIFLVLLILFSGYLIIYSVFSISVTGDIRFYGLLKTIGTTGKQLRRIVRGQAMILSLIGIPLGFAIGYALGCGLTPALVSITSMEHVTTTTNPLIFVFSGVFSLVTVFISCRKPGRIASRVSPVEAVRYTEAAAGKKKEKRARRVSPLSMARANVSRNPRKLIIITLSLSLSMIILNSVYSMVRGFDMERYLEDMILSDFSVADLTIYSPMSAQDNFEGVDSGVLSGLSQLEGLEEAANIYFRDDLHSLSAQGRVNMDAALDILTPLIVQRWPAAINELNGIRESGALTTHIYGVSPMVLRLLNRDGAAIDADRLLSGDCAIVTRSAIGDGEQFPPVYNVGDKIPLVCETGETREFEVIAVVDEYPHAISCGHSHSVNSEIIISAAAYLDFYGEKQPMMAVFNISDEHIPTAEKWLENYCSSVNPSLDYRSRDFYKSEFENMQRIFLLLGGALSFILAFIGLLNFINSVFTSIYARRRELAMLQSVGMTGRQLKIMLFCEGAAYAILTILFSITAGSLLSKLITQGIAGQMWIFEGGFTIIPSLLAMPLMLAICAVVPLVCYRFMRKESVVERLRTE